MSSSLYEQTIPGFIKSLRNLTSLLEKAIQFSQEKSLAPEKILASTLFDEDKGIPHHVQLCSNVAKLTAFRLSGTEMPIFEDDEETFEQLLERIRLTIEALEKVHPSSMAGREHQELFVEARSSGRYIFDTLQRYVSEYAIPHFHFHFTSIYAALRQQGVPVEFMDYFADVFVPAP
ncbi:hypothetical protein HJFPF1_02614 [Paramyrothecium foliicola]|nr:hypothetical protein HJFPF1_02614 [Paramyrothecium foliicola]